LEVVDVTTKNEDALAPSTDETPQGAYGRPQAELKIVAIGLKEEILVVALTDNMKGLTSPSTDRNY
jgi:hypothetical protein